MCVDVRVNGKRETWAYRDVIVPTEAGLNPDCSEVE